MPDQAGVFVRLYRWAAVAAGGANNDTSHADAYDDDVAQALNNRVTRDGTSTAAADLPMGNHTTTGIRQAANPGEPIEFSQAQTMIAAAGGSVLNRIQNASFLVNQRGVTGNVSLGTNSYGGHDRWKGGSGGCAYSFASVGADVQVSIGSGSLQQIVAASDVDSATMTLSQAGTAQGRVYPAGGTAPAFAACPVTVTNLSPGTAAVVEFTGGTVLRPQLEPGSTAHGYARRPAATDTALCQMYYELRPFNVLMYTGGGTFSLPVYFTTRKAAAPTLTTTYSNNPNGQTLSPANINVDGYTFQVNTGQTNYCILAGLTAASCEP